jgi:hypothetical protein
MSVYAHSAFLPAGYQSTPPASALLFPVRDCPVTVRLFTADSSVTIGGSDVSADGWLLTPEQTLTFTLPANESVYGFYNSVSNYAGQGGYVNVLVIELVG